jgi:hypothetical protein
MIQYELLIHKGVEIRKMKNLQYLPILNDPDSIKTGYWFEYGPNEYRMKPYVIELIEDDQYSCEIKIYDADGSYSYPDEENAVTGDYLVHSGDDFDLVATVSVGPKYFLLDVKKLQFYWDDWYYGDDWEVGKQSRKINTSFKEETNEVISLAKAIDYSLKLASEKFNMKKY